MEQQPEHMRSSHFLTFGFVQSVSPDVTVAFLGDEDFTKMTSGIESYTPTSNDKVACAKIGLSWIILGKVVDL